MNFCFLDENIKLIEAGGAEESEHATKVLPQKL
jgi:hypothetical protein